MKPTTLQCIANTRSQLYTIIGHLNNQLTYADYRRCAVNLIDKLVKDNADSLSQLQVHYLLVSKNLLRYAKGRLIVQTELRTTIDKLNIVEMQLQRDEFDKVNNGICVDKLLKHIPEGYALVIVKSVCWLKHIKSGEAVKCLYFRGSVGLTDFKTNAIPRLERKLYNTYPFQFCNGADAPKSWRKFFEEFK